MRALRVSSGSTSFVRILLSDLDAALLIDDGLVYPCDTPRSRPDLRLNPNYQFTHSDIERLLLAVYAGR